jgi:hypothetical protein
VEWLFDNDTQLQLSQRRANGMDVKDVNDAEWGMLALCNGEASLDAWAHAVRTRAKALCDEFYAVRMAPPEGAPYAPLNCQARAHGNTLVLEWYQRHRFKGKPAFRLPIARQADGLSYNIAELQALARPDEREVVARVEAEMVLIRKVYMETLVIRKAFTSAHRAMKAICDGKTPRVRKVMKRPQREGSRLIRRPE